MTDDISIGYYKIFEEYYYLTFENNTHQWYKYDSEQMKWNKTHDINQLVYIYLLFHIDYWDELIKNEILLFQHTE